MTEGHAVVADAPTANVRRRRDWAEILLAALVTGGATVAVLIAPQLLGAGHHTGGEYVYMGAQIVGSVAFLVAAPVAVAVYGAGALRVPHWLLAAITAAIIAALVSVWAPTNGVRALIAVPVVFVPLWVAVALRRRFRAIREAREAREARNARETDATLDAPAPASPLIGTGATVLLAAIAAALPTTIASAVSAYDLLGWAAPDTVLLSALLGFAPAFVTAAWAVAVVLLIDQRVSPRLLSAVAAGLLTAALLLAPTLLFFGVGHDEFELWPALVSGALVALTVFVAGWPRRRPADVPVQVSPAA
ncbi:hypothetical protein GE115_08915 [Agromyces sp. CFH 90414]|uniref:Uncharacterized protein n=1 Tax=Agromyces agglutinans TaxID=2662258 RepID=A0A6I2F880_9MICO|nr:hypothetical protein [Agromyces agglutinans]MRG59987.1 hypothetical protein [Agromyces agglutinans]